jgi:hypothetical protein
VYEGSPIIEPDGTPKPPDTVSTYTPTARPGSRAPHVWLTPGTSILDFFGKEFVLLDFGKPPTAVVDLVTAATLRNIPLRHVNIVNDEAAALYERRLVLVRPDGQVAWRGDELPSDCARLLRRVTGLDASPVEGSTPERLEA